MGWRPEALVFDFDGVLADTEPLHWKSWAALLLHHGVCLRWEDYCRFGRGVNDERMLESLPQLASRPSIVAQLKEHFESRRQTVREWCAERSPINAPTVKMLKSLGGFRLGLVTGSNRDDVEPVLRAAGIHGCFDALVFTEEVGRHKPDPAPYILVRKTLGVETGIAFEDSDSGMLSASAAGFSALRVADPSQLPKIVEKALAAV